MIHWIDWPVAGVSAVWTDREGGVSQGRFVSFNLAVHVGDRPEHVTENRTRLSRFAQLPTQPVWMNQVHGNDVVKAPIEDEKIEVDALWTDSANVVLSVLTADCLPVLLSDRRGSRVAAVHCGWRGLVSGIIQRTIQAGDFEGGYAWLGPCIRPEHYIVGDDVMQRFSAADEKFLNAFWSDHAGRWHLDLACVANMILMQHRVNVKDSGLDTYSTLSFYSYRRDKITGRQACLIWKSG